MVRRYLPIQPIKMLMRGCRDCFQQGNLRAEKGQCHLYKTDVYQQSEGMLFIAIPPFSLNAAFDFDDEFKSSLLEYRENLGHALVPWCISRSYQANDNKRMHRLWQLSDSIGVPRWLSMMYIITFPNDRQLTGCIDMYSRKITIHTAGFRLYQNAERYLKTADEMQRLFRQYPKALAATQEIADACQFSLDSLQYVYPEEITSEGRTPQQELEKLTWQGAREKFNEARF
jgi:error-prone DNA polymerase